MTTEQEWLGNVPAPLEPTKTATTALEDAAATFTEAARLAEAGDSKRALMVGAEAVAMAAAAVDLYYREADAEFEEVLAKGGGVVRRVAVDPRVWEGGSGHE